MRILITSDIHNNLGWLRYLYNRAPEFDLIALAGDMLDAFDEGGTVAHARDFAKCVAAIRARASVAFTNGNHDLMAFGDEPIGDEPGLLEMLTAPQWWDPIEVMPASGSVIVPGRAAVFTGKAGENLIVSTHLFRFDADFADDTALWCEAAVLRRQYKCQWLALHHVPPGRSCVGDRVGDDDGLREQIERWRPNYLASGHLHRRPFDTDGSFADLVAATACFNPGFWPQSPVPNHIILDTSAGTAEWRAKHDDVGKPRISTIRKL